MFMFVACCCCYRTKRGRKAAAAPSIQKLLLLHNAMIETKVKIGRQTDGPLHSCARARRQKQGPASLTSYTSSQLRDALHELRSSYTSSVTYLASFWVYSYSSSSNTFVSFVSSRCCKFSDWRCCRTVRNCASHLSIAACVAGKSRGRRWRRRNVRQQQQQNINNTCLEDS